MTDVRQKKHYVFQKPEYTNVTVSVDVDTLQYKLPPGVLPLNPFFNYRMINGLEYISFTDKLTNSLNIYDFKEKKLVKQVFIPKNDYDGVVIGECSAWFVNFDSIYLGNHFVNVYRIDSSGNILEKLDIGTQSEPLVVGIGFLNFSPPLIEGKNIYAAAYPFIDQTKLSDIKKWPLLCKLNIETQKRTLIYNLPSLYQSNLYGSLLTQGFYCINENKQFVYSFPADPSIYVYDIVDSEKNCSYFGKSSIVNDSIPPVPASELEHGETTDRAFLVRDSYGPIYYDPFHNRYLRVAEQKLSKEQLATKVWIKESSLIIFDEQFKIIGESKIDKNINLRTLFITKNGMYARTDAFSKDEDNLFFVKLKYSN